MRCTGAEAENDPRQLKVLEKRQRPFFSVKKIESEKRRDFSGIKTFYPNIPNS